MLSEDALNKVQKLKEEGYDRSNIFVVANEIVRKSLSDTLGVRIDAKLDARENQYINDRSMWERGEDAMLVDVCDADWGDQPREDPNTDLLFGYRNAIIEGKIVVVVLVKERRKKLPYDPIGGHTDTRTNH